MAAFHLLVLYFVAAVFAQNPSCVSPAVPTSVYPTGFIDLNPFAGQTFVDASGSYSFSPCGTTATCGQEACQFGSIPIGNSPSWYASGNAATLTLSGGEESDGCIPRSSSINIYCQTTVTEPTLVYLGQSGGDSCIYSMDFIIPCPVPATAQSTCDAADQSQWTYGQGYYCFADGFVQCWGPSGSVESAFQSCPTGTTCQCDAGVECSNHGTESPCA